MSKHRRKWTAAQKLEIINFFKQHGIARTKQEYELSGSLFYKWRDAYELHGEAGLQGNKALPKSNLESEISRLQKELRSYKEMVAERDLAIRIKDEMLKKSISK